MNESLACRIEKRKFEKSSFKNEGANNYKAKKQVLYREHYKINGHTKDKYWKIIGYPSNHKLNTWNREHNRNNNANSAKMFKKKEMDW